MRAIIYLRVSTSTQHEFGLSLQAQQKACELEAKKRGIKKKLIYTDVLSGTINIIYRPDLTQALLELKKGDLFIVAQRDRIARDVAIIFNVERIIQKAGAQLICVAEQDTELSNTMIMHVRVVDLIADHERIMLTHRTKHILQEKKQQNKRVGTIPFGYCLSSNKIHIEPHEKEQEIIRIVHQLYNRKNSVPKIAQKINARGYTNRKGKSFSITQIYRILNKHKPEKNQEHDAKVSKGCDMNTLVKDLRMQGCTLKHITKEIALKGFRTKKGTTYQLTHIARILKRAHIASPKKLQWIPFGYQISPFKGLELCMQEQEIIALVHSLRRQNYSLNAIMHVVNMKGYRSRAGKPFQLTQIVRMLKKQLS